LERVAFDLREEVEEVAAMVAPRAHEKGVELTCRIEVGLERFLLGDAGRFRQILTNLAVNAVKFTERGFVLPDVSSVRIRPGTVRVRCSVQDTGIGIPPERHGDIFEMFQQADDSTTRRFGGTGLGLTISRQLVEMMNGEIGLESMAGQGSTFWFTLEMDSREEPLEEPSESESVRGRRILVVDDNEANRLALTELVSFWGADVGACWNGEEALEELARACESGNPYEVVLLDNKMPGLKGTEVCQRIRQDSRLRDVRIILLSSLDGQEAAAHQWDARLSKPIRQMELHRAVARVLGLHPSDGKATPGRPAMRGEGIKVLVVEDNPVNQELAIELLKQFGFSVELACDGVEAVLAVQSSSFDVVLMDCQMPRMDGFDATAAIRGKPGEVGQVPIIALTAHAMKGDREKCLNAGMDDYLVKPLNAAELVDKVLDWARPRKVATSEDASVPAKAVNEVPIDHEEALRRCGGNRGLLDRLLAKFSEQLHQDVPELTRLIEGRNWAGEPLRPGRP
jgi:CheY-like chemotaxis protein